MHIEITQNQIVIQFSEKESKYIAQKAGPTKVEELSNYVKVKIIKALGLEELENASMLSLGGDFDFDKIKNVSAELKKRKSKVGKPSADIENVSIKEDALNKQGSLFDNEGSLRIKQENERIEEEVAGKAAAENDFIKDEVEEPGLSMDVEIGDEILAELLDKDLLKKRQKPKQSGKKGN